MSENVILYSMTILLMVLIIITLFFNKSHFKINCVVFCLYAIPLYYSLLFKGNGGSSFLRWFYLMVFISIQTLTLIIYFIYRMIKNDTMH